MNSTLVSIFESLELARISNKMQKVFQPFSTCFKPVVETDHDGSVSDEAPTTKVKRASSLSFTKLVSRPFPFWAPSFTKSFRTGEPAAIARKESSADQPMHRCVKRSAERNAASMSPATFTRRRSYINNDKLVRTLKRDSGVRRRFESFARHQYAQENVDFIEDLLIWKNEYPGDYARAVEMVDRYIQEEALLQINISYHARTRLISKINTLDPNVVVPFDIFDEVFKEISALMLDGGIWGSFVWKGGCDHESDELVPAEESNDRMSLVAC